MQRKRNICLRVIFGLYCLVMFWMLFGRSAFDIGKPYFEQVGMNINIIPFKTIRQYINLLIYQRNVYLIPNAFINLFGNIAAFVPLGFLMPCLWRKLQSFKKVFLYSGSVIFIIELIQLFTLRGNCDIDDIILNLFGVILGYFIFQGLRLLYSKKSDNQ